MESLRRLDLIIPIKLFIPGIVPKAVDRQYATRKDTGCLPNTWIIRWLIPVSDTRCLANSERVSYACLIKQCTSVLWSIRVNNDVTYSRMSSVMWCELSIRPRSASSESAAEDL
jgi:hypothetical protein